MQVQRILHELWLCFPVTVVTDSYDNRIFADMTFTFKATDIRAKNVKHLCYVAEILSQVCPVNGIQRIMHAF